MPNPHNIIHIRYIERVQIIEIVEDYRNKEDSHGGPGYYTKEIILAMDEQEIKAENLRNHLKPKL